MKKQKVDDIYLEKSAGAAAFKFNDEVAEVFPDMISRSVPGYLQTLEVIESAAAIFADSETRCYDLGCSLGAATFRIEKAAEGRNCAIVAIDNSPAMIDRLRSMLDARGNSGNISVVLSDILDLQVSEASFVVMAYTLQFVPLERRDAVLKSIRSGMLSNSALVLAEKIAFESESEAKLMDALHTEFKRRNGYSDMEISGKRTALENVLVPETLDSHFKRLRSAGFRDVRVVSKHMNFATLIAIA